MQTGKVEINVLLR